MGYIEMWDSLVDTQDKILRKDLTLRTGMRGKVMVVEKEWVTDELKDCIKRRNKLNREKRWCDGEQRESVVSEWLIQRSKTHELVSKLKGGWEAKKTREARDS